MASNRKSIAICAAHNKSLKRKLPEACFDSKTLFAAAWAIPLSSIRYMATVKRFLILVLATICCPVVFAERVNCRRLCEEAVRAGTNLMEDNNGRVYFSCTTLTWDEEGCGQNCPHEIYRVTSSTKDPCELIGKEIGSAINNPQSSPSGNAVAASVWTRGGGATSRVVAWNLKTGAQAEIDVPATIVMKMAPGNVVSMEPSEWKSESDLSCKIDVIDDSTRKVVWTDIVDVPVTWK